MPQITGMLKKANRYNNSFMLDSQIDCYQYGRREYAHHYEDQISHLNAHMPMGMATT